MFLACPLCQKPLDVPGVYAGHVMKCGHCQGTFTVPEVPGTRPPEAQPVAAPPADPPAPTPTVSAPAPAPTPAAAPPLEIDLDLSDKPADWAHNDWEWLRKKIEDRTRNAALDVEHEAARAAWFDKETARLARKGEAVPGEMSEQWFNAHPMPGYSKGEGGWRRFLSDEEVDVRDELIDRTGKAWSRQQREREEQEREAQKGLPPPPPAPPEVLAAAAERGQFVVPDAPAEDGSAVVQCPKCGRPLRVSGALAGQMMQCPYCAGKVPPPADQVADAVPAPAPEGVASPAPKTILAAAGEMESLAGQPEPYRGAKTVLAGTSDIDLGPEPPAFTQEDIDRALAEQAAYRQERKRQFAISELQGRQGELSPQVEKARAARMARNRSRRGAAQRRVAGRLGLGGIYQAIDFGQDVLTAFGRNDEGTSDPEREMLAELKAIAEKLDVLASIQSGDGASYAERNVDEGEQGTHSTAEKRRAAEKERPDRPEGRRADSWLRSLAGQALQRVLPPMRPGNAVPGMGGGPGGRQGNGDLAQALAAFGRMAARLFAGS